MFSYILIETMKENVFLKMIFIRVFFLNGTTFCAKWPDHSICFLFSLLKEIVNII